MDYILNLEKNTLSKEETNYSNLSKDEILKMLKDGFSFSNFPFEIRSNKDICYEAIKLNHKNIEHIDLKLMEKYGFRYDIFLFNYENELDGYEFLKKLRRVS